jgi:exosome complex RNA-binding protein Rrp42 (RNase PH superfamily)
MRNVHVVGVHEKIYSIMSILNTNGALVDTALLAIFTTLDYPTTTYSLRNRDNYQQFPFENLAVEKESCLCKVQDFDIMQLTVSLTVATYLGHTLVDPTTEEENIADTVLTCVMESKGRIICLRKIRGRVHIGKCSLKKSFYAAKLRKCDINSSTVRSG